MVSNLSKPGAPQPMSPVNQVQQFTNKNPQFLGGMTTPSTRLLPGGGTPFTPRGRSTEVSAVQQSNYRRMDNVKASADRLRQISEAGKARRDAERAAREQADRANSFAGMANNYVEGANVRGGGQTWRSDGKLSKSRNDLLKDASSYLGTKYVLGGRSYKGIDCSGLVMNVYNKLGFNITQHHAGVQGRTIPGVRTSVRNLKPGDIVAWKDGSHIAIYAGNGEIIEAANPRRGTLRRKLWANPNDVYGIAVRLPGE